MIAKKAELYCVTLFFLVVCISILALSITANAQQGPIQQALHSREQAYANLRAAETAGANVTKLAPSFNAACDLLEQAIELEMRGNQTGAASLAAQAESSFSTITTQARSLQEAAVSAQKSNQPPILEAAVESLIVAVAAVGASIIYGKIRAKRLLELRVKMKLRGVNSRR